MYDSQYRYDSNDKKYYQKPKSSHVDIQKINCDSRNINVNCIDITQIPQDGTASSAANEGGAGDAAKTQNGNDFPDRINFEINRVDVCVNVNANE
jgi:hypothetical protein